MKSSAIWLAAAALVPWVAGAVEVAGTLLTVTLDEQAKGAVTRLVDMDVAPYLIASTLNAVLGQRLVRKVCKNCATSYEPTPDILRRLGLTEDQVAGNKFWFGAGCDVCNKSGYKGRKGLYEHLLVTDPIRIMITEKKPTLAIREKARELGMRTMREDGVRNILDGSTTVDEVLRYT